MPYETSATPSDDPYPPETPEQAHRFLRENPSIDAINMAMEDRHAVVPDSTQDRVWDILRQGLNSIARGISWRRMASSAVAAKQHVCVLPRVNRLCAA